MAISVCEVSLTESSLERAERVGDLSAGAIVDFWGVVRSLEEGREITGIEYEAHRSMAEHQMRSIAERAVEKFQVRKICIRHRVGFVPAAEASVVVQVSSSHRGAAFDASRWIMDELKRVVPIWKKPIFKEVDAPEFARSNEDVIAPAKLR